MTPAELESAINLYRSITSVNLLLLLALGILNVVSFFRRKPPLDREVYKKYATKSELREMETRISQVLAEIKTENTATLRDFRSDQKNIDAEQFAVIRSFTASVNRSLSDVSRTLGNIEGKIEACPGRHATELLSHHVAECPARRTA